MNKLIQEAHIIEFGSKKIEFSLTRSDRKSLGIQVHPNKSVKVIAPVDASIEKIFAKVKSKASWILEQQAFFLSFQPLTPPRKYVNGETYLYLGRQYRLKIHQGNNKEVKLKGGYLHTWSPDPEEESVQKLVDAWYRKKAEIHFSQIVEDVSPQFAKYDLPEYEIVIRKMEKRWGSCSPNGRITLNLELIKAPKGCIGYVVIHEMCHLIYPDHTRKFYELQEALLPEWRTWKERLERALA